MVRRRFQRGSLFKRGKREKVWVARWWEDVINADGTMVKDAPVSSSRYRPLSSRRGVSLCVLSRIGFVP